MPRVIADASPVRRRRRETSRSPGSPPPATGTLLVPEIIAVVRDLNTDVEPDVSHADIARNVHRCDNLGHVKEWLVSIGITNPGAAAADIPELRGLPLSVSDVPVVASER